MKKYEKINQTNAAVINRAKVFQIITDHKVIKRDKIAKLTGLQKSTLTYILNDLKKLNLITESKLHEPNKIGVPPLSVSLANNDNFIIGIDVEIDYIKTSILNLNSDIIFTKEFKMKISQNNFETKILEVFNFISETINKKFLFMCIALPGIIDKTENKIIVSNLLSLKNFKPSKEFEKKLGIPIILENNANAAAYGFYYLNYKNKISNMYYIFFHLTKSHGFKNTGIGSAIIINSSLYYGDSYAAGEMGDIIGNIVKKHFPQYSYRKFLQEFINILTDAVQNKNKKSEEIIKKFGYELGKYLGNFINILNIETIIINSDYPLAIEPLSSYIINGIQDTIISFFKDKIKIIKGFDTEYAVSTGAAVIAREKIFEYDYFKKLLRR